MEKRKALGQFMTPSHLATLLVQQFPLGSTSAIDFAAGDCSLLDAANILHHNIKLYGFEIDEQFYEKGKQKLPNALIMNADGLSAELPSFATGLVVVGNPPYSETDPTQAMQKMLKTAFPGLKSKLGRKRSELYFLARSLITAKKHQGTVVILMPMSFADGDIYRHYREILLNNYSVSRVIEISGSTFSATEARTIMMVIDTSKTRSESVEICRYDNQSKEITSIFNGRISSGERLDARYHEGKAKLSSTAPNLQDVGVTIVRGNFSRKEAERMGIQALHTSDLANAKFGKLQLGKSKSKIDTLNTHKSIYAEPGDILLPRTGTRVIWKPIVVQSGMLPITDHVFRIRVPSKFKERVITAFGHPHFSEWLNSVSKGVCATVLTKRELLTMPLFH